MRASKAATAPAAGAAPASRRRRISSTGKFRRSRPNELWLTDITEHPTREGKVYCAVVLDAFSRRVVGWSISHNPTASLTCNALGMAVEQRDANRGTVIHSDHGTQFTAWTFTDRAKKSGLLPSMGSVGDCYVCEQNRCRCSVPV